MKPVSIGHEAYFIFTSNYLEFCIKQDADFIRNIIQFLKLVAFCNLLLLAKINLLTIQFRELAFEHEFMFLLSLSLLSLLKLSTMESERRLPFLSQNPKRISTPFILSVTGSLWQKLIVWLLVVIRLFLLRISTETSLIPCFFLMLTCNTGITTS